MDRKKAKKSSSKRTTVLKVLTQVKTKKVKFIKDMYWDGELEKYEWIRYGNNDIFKIRDGIWLQDIIVNMHHHGGTMGVKYKEKIDGVLRNKVLDRIAKKSIENTEW